MEIYIAANILICGREIYMWAEKNHTRDPAKRKAQWSERSFHVANRHMQMLYLRITLESVYHLPLFNPLCFFTDVSATILSRIVFILFLF